VFICVIRGFFTPRLFYGKFSFELFNKEFAVLNQSDRSVVLITGASTGFGLQTAVLLAEQGFRVFGTTRNPNPPAAPNYQMLTCDVQSDDSVKKCVQTVLDQAGRIDVLINNAGVVLNGPAEETTLDQAHDILETNFFGLVRVTNAVLPIMHRQGKGRIVNIASLAGRVGVPGHSFYSASKFAVEGYTETLAHELHQFRIKVSLVEPGFFKTNLGSHAPQAENPIAAYDAVRDHLTEHFQKGVATGGDPVDVASLISKILHTKKPKLRYPIGHGSVAVPFFKAITPQRLFARAVRLYFRLP
jgi:NAD(P)-dependent dehydrogenase (short-subunit alcohol dehydrogenase family)